MGNRIAEWLRRVWYLLHRDRFDAALRREMEAHRAMMGEPERFGNTLKLREDSRDAWGWRWLDDFVRDLRFGARALRRTTAFTSVAVLSLALAVALTASTIAVVNAYLIRSLPYPARDRVYMVRYAPPGPWEPRGMTALDWKSVEDVVEFPIVSAGDTFYFRDGGRTVALLGIRVNAGYFEGIGVPVAMGRRLTEQDYHAAAEPVVLIGHSLWRNRFGSDPGAIGRSITVEGETRAGRPETFRIIGVLAPEYSIARDRRADGDLLMPLTTPARAYMLQLREGVPPAVAERRLTEAARHAATSPIPDDWSGVTLESAHERYVGRIRPILVGVAIAVSLVLVIVCANVAVLMLLRAMQRQKEIAVRLALGSGLRHIARMLFAETCLICGAALAAGLTLTALSLRALAPLIETQLGRPAPRGTSSIAVDTNVLMIVGGVSLVVALAISLAPLVTVWGRQLTDTLRRDGRGATDGASMRRVRSALIAFEVAGSLVLLVACGLMVRSVIGMLQTDFGFETDGLVRTRIVLRARYYPDAAAYQRFYRQFAAGVSTLAASPVVFTSWPPFYETPTLRIETFEGVGGITAGAVGVSAGYFEMFGIDIRQGRAFTDSDASSAQPVAVISETLALRLWPDGSAAGRRIRGIEETPGGATPGPWRTVVGVAADVRQTYADENRYDLYLPLFPESRYASFHVRAARPLPQLLENFRAVASGIDPEAVIDEPRLVAGENRQLAGMRFLTSMLTGFAAIAAFLAALGIYGVTAYAVQQREREVAIRVALGASGRAVIRMFLKDGGVMLGVGLAVGALGALAAARLLRNQMYGVQAFDISTFAAACVLMGAAGALATWWPARRAATADPVAALNAN
jgi:putative ABC transport system permease protein